MSCEESVREKLNDIINPKPDDFIHHLWWNLFVAGKINLQVVNGKLSVGLTPVGGLDAEKILKELHIER